MEAKEWWTNGADDKVIGKQNFNINM